VSLLIIQQCRCLLYGEQSHDKKKGPCIEQIVDAHCVRSLQLQRAGSLYAAHSMLPYLERAVSGVAPQQEQGTCESALPKACQHDGAGRENLVPLAVFLSLTLSVQEPCAPLSPMSNLWKDDNVSTNSLLRMPTEDDAQLISVVRQVQCSVSDQTDWVHTSYKFLVSK
jgi:hypothetical protein